MARLFEISVFRFAFLMVSRRNWFCGLISTRRSSAPLRHMLCDAENFLTRWFPIVGCLENNEKEGEMEREKEEKERRERKDREVKE